MEIGNSIDDFELIDDLGYDTKTNQHLYLAKCVVCGRQKVVSASNLRKQDCHHSKANCREDYYKQFIGKQFGDFVVTDVTKSNKGYACILECKICGQQIKETAFDGNKEFKHTQAICKNAYMDLVGKQIGDLRVLNFREYSNTYRYYDCECVVCKQKFIKSGIALKNRFNHGTECIKAAPNDEYKNTILQRYNNIYQRCNNPLSTNYPHYGGRGVKLCYDNSADFYQDFIDEFKEHADKYGIENTTFDRIDVNGNYAKENIRLTTMSVQNTNTTRKRYFIISNGSDKIIGDSAMEVGRRLGLNGRSIGNVVRGASRSCGGWTLVKRFAGNLSNKDIEEIIAKEGVTTNMITTM